MGLEQPGDKPASALTASKPVRRSEIEEARWQGRLKTTKLLAIGREPRLDSQLAQRARKGVTERLTCNHQEVKKLTRQAKTAFELEKIVAELAGFDQQIIIVSKVGHDGDFTATVTSRTAWLTKATAQSEVDKVCAKLKATHRLET
jgi:hypothetical protein